MQPQRPAQGYTPRPTTAGVAWFSPDQWELLRRVAADKQALHDTYDEWVADAFAALRNLEQPGFAARPLEVDVDELLRWCRGRRRPLDGAARSAFVAEKLEQASKGG